MLFIVKYLKYIFVMILNSFVEKIQYTIQYLFLTFLKIKQIFYHKTNYQANPFKNLALLFKIFQNLFNKSKTNDLPDLILFEKSRLRLLINNILYFFKLKQKKYQFICYNSKHNILSTHFNYNMTYFTVQQNPKQSTFTKDIVSSLLQSIKDLTCQKYVQQYF
ncbi:hypothetical protein TTHERM_000346911 (macronuclear) [Tetrahymena thermophila SB210]|uniref:Uncharacterized protein n=1 Tax=Tetrahymena thermophila (strain SB210) TaxID=312017 RepID=W7XJ31_TETTS|nr:hypothetical protein TTHERM_000346911 [Tetrahymena thermophila SB210]EWS73809.1 hypothetical protein TTHERM_000346911 [Tetrahymena thermophila SB210]|eukprot:XP_012653689.1 hypothetical protein TTHERM_000346911 [Tetrahymena thermophila SB210]